MSYTEPRCNGKLDIIGYVIVQECEHSGDMQDAFAIVKRVGVSVVNWTESLDGEYETGAIAFAGTAQDFAKLKEAFEDDGTGHVTSYAPERWTGKEIW